MSSFRTVMRQEQPSVQQQMVTNHEQLACENRQKLKSIISVIDLCARQNIALRGHRSEDWNPAAEEEPASNPGNFLALLRFRVDAGDTSVARDFHLVPGVGGRTTYRSPSIQNELIDCCGDVVLDQLLKVETSVTSIRPRRCTGLGLCIPCIHRMAHSDTSALNASGVKGIDVGATATAAGCSGKTQLHGDLSFVFLRPADQKLWVLEDFEALKLLFRGRSRPFKVDF